MWNYPFIEESIKIQTIDQKREGENVSKVTVAELYKTEEY